MESVTVLISLFTMKFASKSVLTLTQSKKKSAVEAQLRNCFISEVQLGNEEVEGVYLT